MSSSTKRNLVLRKCKSAGVVNIILFGIVSLFASAVLVEVDSFRLGYSPPTTVTPPATYRCDNFPTRRHGYSSALGQKQERSSRVILNSSEDDDTNATNNSGNNGILESIGLVSQPIVWISLYFLGTTGHGLPAGPGGSIGAVEGIAYLVVVVLAVLPGDNSSSPLNARTFSRATIALGLLVLAGVAAGKGCVPNAKPILDYSAYLPVCGPE